MRWLPALALMLSPASFAEDCTVRSGPQTTALIELYTSEGCSSCPPADRWLSTFTASKAPLRVVPIAFHVSYWDYIGWKDPFADERHTARQRERAKTAGARSVYTPQVVLGGKDFPRWSQEREFASRVDAINRVPARAWLEINARSRNDGQVTASISARRMDGHDARDLAIVAALTQRDLKSRVTAGENRGEFLRHDFVTRDLSTSRPFESSTDAASIVASFKPRADWNLASMSLVAFVQDVKTGEVLQALSAPICR